MKKNKRVWIRGGNQSTDTKYATYLIELAKAEISSGDYSAALDQINAALKRLPYSGPVGKNHAR